MGIIKDATADMILTSMWIFSMPVSRIYTNILLAHLGIPPNSLLTIIINIFSASLLLLIFSLIARAFGGANFNPSTSVAFLAAGQSSGGSLLSAAVRFPAQAAGGVAGVKAILGLLPSQYTAKLRGPSLKVDLHTGAFAEGALTFVFCISVLSVLLRGPKSPLLKVWVLSNVTYGLVYVGYGFTGPSMNPANAFGWAFVNNTHDTWQHFYVFWLCPIVGAFLAACAFRVLFSKNVAVNKEKNA